MLTCVICDLVCLKQTKRIVSILVDHGPKIHMTCSSWFQCKELYFTVKDAMEKAATRNHGKATGVFVRIVCQQFSVVNIH